MRFVLHKKLFLGLTDPDPGGHRMRIRIRNTGVETGRRLHVDREEIASQQYFDVRMQIGQMIVGWLNQCCGFGSGIRCFFTPWIRDPDPG
jgi:hypothetical protein